MVRLPSRPRSRAAQIERRVPCTAHGGLAAMVRASRSAASASWLLGTTSDTRPISRADAAEIRSPLPVSDIRMTSPNGMRPSIFMGS